MLHWTQQLRIDPYQTRERHGVKPIILPPALPDQSHAARVRHDRLMTELNDSLSAFVADLKQQGNFDRVLLMTFSEFGRRVAENANGGTDHGAAAPMFVLGGAVKPGLFGKYPSLTDLDHGDLKFNTDFRSVYGTVLDRWLKAPSEIVLGRKFPALAIV